MLKTDYRKNVVSGWIASNDEGNAVIKVRLEFPEGIEEAVIPRQKFNLDSRNAAIGEAEKYSVPLCATWRQDHHLPH